ncbi:MAG: uracil-DNA glycosylase [Mycobacterium leprae]
MELEQYTDLESLGQAVTGCQNCSLRAGCHGVVFGEGNPQARLVLCGEGPGQEEDRLLRPFVGAAGQLLDKILAASGFERFQHTYILNVVKCRPPGNRIPLPEEREACRPNLTAQLRILQPAIVVLLGATALQTLIDPNARITRMRGTWIERDGVWYMPTYHPAALLRDANLKKAAWADFKQVIDKYRELVDPAHQSPHYPGRSTGATEGGR